MQMWRLAQVLGIIAATTIIVGFVWLPEFTLRIFWGILIPLLPATFLISPLIWRSVCPIATVNMLGNGWMGRRKLPAHSIPAVSMAGIILFGLLVPARHLAFNDNGVILAATSGAVFVAAFILGVFFDNRSGFCNAVCPVLPVEKLYGHRPLIEMKSVRCASCQLCTAKGCLDVSPQKSIEKIIAPAHRSQAWLKTPMGIFALALPGFILGYFTSASTPWFEMTSLYLYIGACCAGSYALLAGLMLLLRWPSSRGLIILAAISVGLYYAYASPQIAEALTLGPMTAWGIRCGTFILIGFWLWRGLRR